MVSVADSNGKTNSLNPRRMLHAKAMIDYLVRFGRKMWLPKYSYHCHTMTGLPEYAVGAAIDDLYDLGLVEMRESGDGVVVELLTDEVDAAPATRPAATPKASGGERRYCPDGNGNDYVRAQRQRTPRRQSDRMEVSRVR
jgi:hypothetical protein